MKGKAENLTGSFLDSVEDCVSLLENELPQINEVLHSKDPLPSLLDQCEELIEADQGKSEPIRTIHHLACTGGTIISKCLSAMPNTHVLSEVEPHSKMEAQKRFAPTNVIQLLRASSRPSSVTLETKVFLGAIGALYEDCQRKGICLLLRDHAHSKFCFGEIDGAIPTLAETLANKYELLSIVTVRHPLDSYMSLRDKKWVNFEPQTLEEYSKRYFTFLESITGKKIFKYEDFVDNSESFMRDLCSELRLRYSPEFSTLLGVHKLSGDSGRSSNTIKQRPRKEVPKELEHELQNSESFCNLCETLSYEY